VRVPSTTHLHSFGNEPASRPSRLIAFEEKERERDRRPRLERNRALTDRVSVTSRLCLSVQCPVISPRFQRERKRKRESVCVCMVPAAILFPAGRKPADVTWINRQNGNRLELTAVWYGSPRHAGRLRPMARGCRISAAGRTAARGRRRIKTAKRREILIRGYVKQLPLLQSQLHFSYALRHSFFQKFTTPRM